MVNMENTDLKWIKKHYCERFSHLCRELFPTLLEKEGLLKKLISGTFLPSRELYDDLTRNNAVFAFKNYIYNLTELEKDYKITNNTPEELMDKAGYILYPECQTENDIQSFRHYYFRNGPTPIYKGGVPEQRQGEEICTFNGGRLSSCRVWFAVKKNVNEIRREDFKNPRREDDYGVSVISIQFSKRSPSTLSIKNRYNHTITDVNPDSTFGNNLDNIIEGLTQAFTKKYGIELLKNNNYGLELPNYIKKKKKKFYKYNLEINNVYYCPNNTIIVNGEVKTFDKDKYILFDHFLLDLDKKKITDYIPLARTTDAFVESIGEIKEIKRIPSSEGLTIEITPQECEVIEIKLNKHNQMVGLKNPNVTNVQCGFLEYNKTLTELSLPNAIDIGRDFLYNNNSLTEITLPSAKNIGSDFLRNNNSLTEITLPSAKNIGSDFLRNNNTLTDISLPNAIKIGYCFLYNNNSVTNLFLPNVLIIGNDFLYHNNSLENLSLPNVQEIRNDFLSINKKITEVFLPNVKKVGENFLYYNNSLKELSLPNIQEIGYNFLSSNNSLIELHLPNVKKIGSNFLYHNNLLTEIYMQNVEQINNCFLCKNTSLVKLSLPSVKYIGDSFLFYNNSLVELSLPNVLRIGNDFLCKNNTLTEISLPNVTDIGRFFLVENNMLTEISLPNVTNIGSYFLDENRVLTKLDMPKVNKIESPILDNCRSMTEVNLPPKFIHIKNDILKRSHANIEDNSKENE